MSTVAELLATYAALHAFGFLQKEVDTSREGKISLVGAGTDNLANEFLARKRLTTKLPLGLLMLQFYTKLWDNGLWLKLTWRPREENVEADDLTNGKFEKFEKARRINLQYSDLDTRVLDALQGTLLSFEESTKELKGIKTMKRGLTKRQKVESKTDW